MPGQRPVETSVSEAAEAAARAEWERLAEASAPRLLGREQASLLEEPMRRAFGQLAKAPPDFTDALQKLREQFSSRPLSPLEESQVPPPRA
jgi:hypothetical protein